MSSQKIVLLNLSSINEPARPALEKKENIKRSPAHGTISIKNHISEKEKEKSEEDLSNKPSDEFSQEQLENAWTVVSRNYEPDKNLHTTLSKHKPLKAEDFIVKFTVDNKIQKKEIEDRLIDFLPKFRAKLNNFKIQLNILVNEQPTVDKPYTPQDKFNYMAEKNPALRKLKDQLGLEIDF
ncbi:MAG: hypothetical protein B6D61_07585 [Bacteroidetes bacterium 4484_249]|nr:MAG: hypothetical protein B6D61_07585 [Bacteroidetes bacterium 4484_249]